MYGISINEAMKLSDAERDVLLEHAGFALLQQAMTNTELQTTLRSTLQPALREVRAAREQGSGGMGSPS
jgi:hypothetical protein